MGYTLHYYTHPLTPIPIIVVFNSGNSYSAVPPPSLMVFSVKNLYLVPEMALTIGGEGKLNNS